SVIVRRASIEQSFEGGWSKFVSCVPNGTLCWDQDLARVGFMDPKSVESFVKTLQQGGLEFMSQGKFMDIAVVDQQTGPTEPCTWLEFTKARFDEADGRVAVCWLFEGPRIMGPGLYTRGLEFELVTPVGWTYEGSLSERFSFMPTEEVGS